MPHCGSLRRQAALLQPQRRHTAAGRRRSRRRRRVSRSCRSSGAIRHLQAQPKCRCPHNPPTAACRKRYGGEHREGSTALCGQSKGSGSSAAPRSSSRSAKGASRLAPSRALLASGQRGGMLPQQRIHHWVQRRRRRGRKRRRAHCSAQRLRGEEPRLPMLMVQDGHERFLAYDVAHENGVVLLPALRPRKQVRRVRRGQRRGSRPLDRSTRLAARGQVAPRHVQRRQPPQLLLRLAEGGGLQVRRGPRGAGARVSPLSPLARRVRRRAPPPHRQPFRRCRQAVPKSCRCSTTGAARAGSPP